ncbi:DegT/DnrJ/EryC1/StrS aminotransferase family protein [Mesotoga sp. B105.6.4]|uniref:DegT/DnrJ/EryC1/StrS family aminotransferase n=1 Tax=Mesotoga sp. B105.6.4 TaxID=1582224 RepID=UPI0021557FB8|nr:DegT/DnrJ/EryC1/StrS family aminotransferase [Mesotoga sp. B105.6.4]
MPRIMSGFDKPIYVTRPLLPPLEELCNSLQDIWDAQWLANNGAKHKELESKLRDYLKVPQLSLFNNGTIALLVAIKALELTGEVITTPFTFAATAHSISWMGLEPVFVDIDPVTMCIDPNRIEEAITPKTSAIMPVHVFGTPCDVKAIQEISDKYNLKVIYDAAHAFGTEINGTGIGNFGDITMYSFHATKLFNSAEGGALACKSEEMKKKIDLLKNFGIKNEEEVIEVGINGKMNELQAAMGLTVLEHIEEERQKRAIIKQTYIENLKDIPGIKLMPVLPGVRSSYQYFAIRIDEEQFGRSRNDVYEELKKYNVYARKYFHPLCSNYECYKHLPSADRNNLPIANKIGNGVLSMPFYGGLTKEDVETICEIVRCINEQ